MKRIIDHRIGCIYTNARSFEGDACPSCLTPAVELLDMNLLDYPITNEEFNALITHSDYNLPKEDK